MPDLSIDPARLVPFLQGRLGQLEDEYARLIVDRDYPLPGVSPDASSARIAELEKQVPQLQQKLKSVS